MLNVLNDNSSRKIVIDNNGSTKSAKETKNKNEVKSVKVRKPAIKKLDQIVCPKCGTGSLIKGHTAYGCSRYKEGCDMKLPFESYSPELSPAKLNQLIKKQYGG